MTVDNLALELPSPLQEGFLEVSGGHKIYYAVYGNENGVPVLCCHGGPGGGSQPNHALNFDLSKWKVVLFDQRGCGKSEPWLRLEENTTPHLLEDMESLRKHLGVEKWVVQGGSWGSTLALLYAEKYVDRVLGLLLRGIFLARKQDVAWVYEAEGAAKFYPKEYKEFSSFVQGGGKMLSYAEKVLEGSEKERLEASLNALNWVGKLCSMESTQIAEEAERLETEKEMSAEEKEQAQVALEKFALTHSTLELWYEKHGFFIEEGQILKNISKIKHIPTQIVHGRYDMCCLVEGAYFLHEALENSTLTVVPHAGHTGSEMKGEIVASAEDMLELLGRG